MHCTFCCASWDLQRWIKLQPYWESVVLSPDWRLFHGVVSLRWGGGNHMRKQKVQRLFRAWQWHRRRRSWTGWFPCLKMILCFYHTRLMACLVLEFWFGNHFSLWTLKTLLYYLLVSRNEKSFTIWTLDAFYTFPSISLEACGMFSFLRNLKLHSDWYSRGFIFSHCVGFLYAVSVFGSG